METPGATPFSSAGVIMSATLRAMSIKIYTGFRVRRQHSPHLARTPLKSRSADWLTLARREHRHLWSRCYHPRQFNPRRQSSILIAFGKVEGLKLLTGVPSGTGQFCDDVNQRGQSHRVAQILLGIDLPGYTGVAHHLVQRMAQVFGDGLHHPVTRDARRWRPVDGCPL